MKLYSTVLLYKSLSKINIFQFWKYKEYLYKYYQSIFFIRDTWSYFLWSMDYLTLGFWEIKKVFYCIVFCGLLRFICWKLSQELDKKHCMIKNFCHNSTIFLDWCRYFQIKLQVDLSGKKIQHFNNERSLLMIYFILIHVPSKTTYKPCRLSWGRGDHGHTSTIVIQWRCHLYDISILEKC